MTLPDETPNSNTLVSIELTNSGKYMKEVYFKDGQGSVFTYRTTRKQLKWTLILAVVCAIFYIVSLSFDQVAYVMIFTITGFFGAISLIWFLLNAQKYFKWKTAVNMSIKEADSYKKALLNVKSGGFEAIYDDQVVIEKWANFDRATIGPTHIFLVNKETNYIFPSNCMKDSEYEALSQIVRSKVGNEETNSEKPKES